jgi:hypothetical protein
LSSRGMPDAVIGEGVVDRMSTLIWRYNSRLEDLPPESSRPMFLADAAAASQSSDQGRNVASESLAHIELVEELDPDGSVSRRSESRFAATWQPL